MPDLGVSVISSRDRPKQEGANGLRPDLAKASTEVATFMREHFAVLRKEMS